MGQQAHVNHPDPHPLGRPPLRGLDSPPGPIAAARPAGFLRRALAVLIDGVVIMLLKLPINVPIQIARGLLAAPGGKPSQASTFLTLISFVVVNYGIIYLYFGWFYSNRGATPGKMLLGLKVVDSETGTHLSYGRSFMREAFAKLVSLVLLGAGFLMVIFRSDRKALHDLIMSTEVIHQER